MERPPRRLSRKLNSLYRPTTAGEEILRPKAGSSRTIEGTGEGEASSQGSEGNNTVSTDDYCECENAEFQTRTRGRLNLRNVSRTIRNQPTSPETRAANISIES